jgi:hypothetical protein
MCACAYVFELGLGRSLVALEAPETPRLGAAGGAAVPADFVRVAHHLTVIGNAPRPLDRREKVRFREPF